MQEEKNINSISQSEMEKLLSCLLIDEIEELEKKEKFCRCETFDDTINALMNSLGR